MFDTLRVPPGNKLEALLGVRKGQCSVRVNQQWRICFRSQAGNALDVEIVDYHRPRRGHVMNDLAINSADVLPA